ncbi:IS30 family transposase [Rhodococcus maanshanensis]|nr:IS30 family transposase [Rhodococcus maanshanensis]
MQQGVSNLEACRIVGIHYRTGRGWRNGRRRSNNRPATPPTNAEVSQACSGRYLQEKDRIYIADRLREKASLRTIARELGRSPSTVSREIRRNTTPTSRQYRPHAAHARATARLPRPKAGKIARIPALREAIQDLLHGRWSPEQISQRLRRDFPEQPEMHVTHETIYQALYTPGRGDLHRDLHRALRTARPRRKRRRHPEQRQRRYSSPMVMIKDRPAEVDDRAIPGHWEGDLIIGKNGFSAIGTLVERTSRYVMLVHLPCDRSATTVRDRLVETLHHVPAHLKRSLTWDQGSEMGRHHELTRETGIPVYFCEPGKPWQRGSNENTNGLLRQYFPKGTDLSQHSRHHLDAVAAQINARPRKALGWDTPAERLAKLTAA